MMKTMKTGFAGVLMALLAGIVMAQQGGLDKAAILKELDKLLLSHREKVMVEQKSIGDALKKALSNTRELIELYEEAVFATRFEGAKKDNTDFKKWKNAQDDTLKSGDFQAALSIHANYLYLTFLRASGEDEGKLNEALIQHVLKVWTAEGKFDLRTRTTTELLDRLVTQGVLARSFHLGPKLGGPQEGEKPKEQDKTWEWTPANTDGMLDRTVFPFLRANKSQLLIPLWDKRIANEAARVKRAGLSDKATQFTQQTLPRLHWQRARDLVLQGKEAEGLSTMIGILRLNANLTEFGTYASELRTLLAGGEATNSEKSE